VDPLSDQTLQLSQSEVNFVNTEINELYEISLTVRNVSQLSQKIKIRKPVSPAFTVQSSREGSLAAGLDLRITVLYNSKENTQLSDRMFVLTETAELEIPINVYPQVGKLQFEPFINFGFLKTDSSAEVSWDITNKGDNSANISFQPLMIEQQATLGLSA
jgi:hypothetical protein